MSKKPCPWKVDCDLARRAFQEAAGNTQTAWSHYIVFHFRATGDLAPGCDMRDLRAWYEANAVAAGAVMEERP